MIVAEKQGDRIQRAMAQGYYFDCAHLVEGLGKQLSRELFEKK